MTERAIVFLFCVLVNVHHFRNFCVYNPPVLCINPPDMYQQHKMDSLVQQDLDQAKSGSGGGGRETACADIMPMRAK